MRRFAFVSPKRLDDAVAVLTQYADRAKLIAGGTDLSVQMKDGLRRPDVVIDITGLRELHALEEREDGLHLGALTTMGMIQNSPLLKEKYPILVDSAMLVGSLQVRNLATIGGNQCTASPGADTSPTLIALGAVARVVGPTGERRIPMDQFFTGPGRTVLGPGEIVVEFVIPKATPQSGAYYERHTPRKELDIAVVGVAAWVQLDGDRIADARIGLAAVYPTPLRATDAEAVLRGQPIADTVIAQAAEAAMAQSRPISDVRGSAEFRRMLVNELTKRSVNQAIARAQGRGLPAGGIAALHALG
ncbi:MAG: xanthine dehydrogenase family protein subunit M [Dehalococcoidia bacterium]|nr:xanthine dehydrogenase family protein subunit M [Dehalococcoidia bacterium]